MSKSAARKMVNPTSTHIPAPGDTRDKVCRKTSPSKQPALIACPNVRNFDCPPSPWAYPGKRKRITFGTKLMTPVDKNAAVATVGDTIFCCI
jgi:hypothetical protein